MCLCRKTLKAVSFFVCVKGTKNIVCYPGVETPFTAVFNFSEGFEEGKFFN